MASQPIVLFVNSLLLLTEQVSMNLESNFLLYVLNFSDCQDGWCVMNPSYFRLWMLYRKVKKIGMQTYCTRFKKIYFRKLSRVTALEKMELTSQGFPVLTILRKTEVSCEHFR
jgi:hypothetical protein